jgi:5-carboxymethyl-2-hydroxymuconate isomerase
MSQETPFRIDVGSLKSRSKDSSPQAVERVDHAGEKHGFVDRQPKKQRGRKPSPRTGQVHAKVMPVVADEIADEAKRRGVQQGVVIEEAWALYRAQKGL